MKTHDHIETIIDSTHLKVQSAGKHNRCKLAFLCLVASSLLLSACVPIVSQPTIDGTMTSSEVIGTPTSTQTESPTYTPTATNTPEPTATPAPLEGRLFFDMNGSGLRDQASFNYDAERLTDERQPLQLDLLAAIEAYVAGHPELKDGDLITLEEPGLSGYTVCADDNCTISNADGSFILPGAKSTSSLKITDPNAGTPALEMRYINKWNKAVTIPAYEMNGVQVPEQHLTDTEVLSISTTVQVGKIGEIGLMQGFLTLPFEVEQVPKPFIWNYFDIIGYRTFNSQVGYFDTQDGFVLNYDGTMTKEGNPFTQTQGVGDSHNGLDFSVSTGTFVVNTGPTSYVRDLLTESDGQLLAFLWFDDSSFKSYTMQTQYCHLNAFLVGLNQQIYRGQIIALSGITGNRNTFNDRGTTKFVPQLHFDLANITNEGSHYLDPFRSLIVPNKTLENYWGSTNSFWNIDNLPVFYK